MSNLGWLQKEIMKVLTDEWMSTSKIEYILELSLFLLHSIRSIYASLRRLERRGLVESKLGHHRIGRLWRLKEKDGEDE